MEEKEAELELPIWDNRGALEKMLKKKRIPSFLKRNLVCYYNNYLIHQRLQSIVITLLIGYAQI